MLRGSSASIPTSGCLIRHASAAAGRRVLTTWYDSGTSTLETYHSNFIARQSYVQKYMKYRKSQYWPPVGLCDVTSLAPFYEIKSEEYWFYFRHSIYIASNRNCYISRLAPGMWKLNSSHLCNLERQMGRWKYASLIQRLLLVLEVT